jgi:bifunctional non-homologous end joining protein LigD
MIRNITPLPLRSERVPFDHPDWIFELKYDGFRALAYIENGRCRLVSRNGHPFSAFSELEKWIEASIPANTVLDGEVVRRKVGGGSRSFGCIRPFLNR